MLEAVAFYLVLVFPGEPTPVVIPMANESRCDIERINVVEAYGRQAEAKLKFAHCVQSGFKQSYEVD